MRRTGKVSRAPPEPHFSLSIASPLGLGAGRRGRSGSTDRRTGPQADGHRAGRASRPRRSTSAPSSASNRCCGWYALLVVDLVITKRAVARASAEVTTVPGRRSPAARIRSLSCREVGRGRCARLMVAAAVGGVAGSIGFDVPCPVREEVDDSSSHERDALRAAEEVSMKYRPAPAAGRSAGTEQPGSCSRLDVAEFYSIIPTTAMLPWVGSGAKSTTAAVNEA